MSTEQLQQEDRLKYLISVSTQLFIPTLYENVIKNLRSTLLKLLLIIFMWPFIFYYISTPEEVSGYNKFLVNHLYVVKFSSMLSVYMILMCDIALLSLCID